MRTSRNIAAIILLTSLPGLAACDSFNEGFDDSWKEEMVKACIPEAVKNGAPADFAKEQCGCMADKLLAELDGIAEKSNPPMDKIQKAATECVMESELPVAA